MSRDEAVEALAPEVYVNEYEPWVGVLVSDATLDEARRAAEAEVSGSGLPVTYLGIRTEPILKENGAPGRRRRFYVFTDEPQGSPILDDEAKDPATPPESR